MADSQGLHAHPRHWTSEEDAQLRAAIEAYGASNWRLVGEEVPGRTHLQCMQRWKKALRPGLVKGPWSEVEDEALRTAIAATPGFEQVWGRVADQVAGRTAKQCRERWRLNLDPSLLHGPWEPDEDALLLSLLEQHGRRWAKISRGINGRTEHSVKTRALALERERDRNRTWTAQEDDALMASVARNVAGNWGLVAKDLPRRNKSQAKARHQLICAAAGPLPAGMQRPPPPQWPPPPPPRQRQESPRQQQRSAPVSRRPMTGRTQSVELLLSLLGDETRSSAFSAPVAAPVAASAEEDSSMRRFATSGGSGSGGMLWEVLGEGDTTHDDRLQGSMNDLRMSDRPLGGDSPSTAAQPQPDAGSDSLLGWMDEEFAMEYEDGENTTRLSRIRSRPHGMRRLRSEEEDFDLV